MKKSPWKEHFGKEVSGYDPVASQGLSELGHTLKQGDISENDYLTWARAHYELSSLDMKFFQTNAAPRALFDRLKDVFSWGPECLPVAEWDDHVIIAGLEKPMDLPPDIKPIFLLAPLTGLSVYWENFSNEALSAAPAAPAQEEGGGLLEGISLEIQTAPSLSFAGIGVRHDEKPVEEKTASGIPLTISQELKTLKKPLAETRNMATVPLTPKKAPPEKLEVKAPPAKLEIKAQPVVLEDITQSQIKKAPEPSLKIDESLIRECFQKYKNHYEKRAYLEFNMKQKQAWVKLYPDEMVIPEEMRISLEQDSFLSIVAKTQKPYHGFVVKTPATQQIFKSLSGGEIPENVTVVPVVTNDEVIGALMGWGPKTTYNLQVLRDLEKITLQLSTKLGLHQSEAA